MSSRRLAELEAAGQPTPFTSFTAPPRAAAAKAGGRWVAVRKAPRQTGPAREVVDLVLDRDHHSCVVCANSLHGVRGRDWSVHHRDPRGMGGTSRSEVNLPSNLLVVCGSGTTGCHGWIEARRSEAEEMGLLLRGNEKPTEVPVATWYGVVLLNDEGGYTELSREVAA